MSLRFNVYKLHSFLSKRKHLKYREQIYELQQKDREEILQHQLNSLNKLLESAIKNSSFYKSYKKFFPLTSLKDLEKLPILKKENLQKNLEDISNKNKINNKYVFINQTGGSIGRPVKFYQTQYQRDMGVAAELLWYSKIGYRFSKDKLLKLWGHPQDLSLNKKFLYKLRNYIVNQHIFDVFKFRIEELVKDLKANPPDWIEGYSSSIYFLSKYLVDNNIIIPEVKGIIFAAEKPFDLYIETAKQAFVNAKTFERYGSREFSFIAGSCFHPGLHYDMGRLIVEITKNKKILITDLTNDATYFIRYEIGDIAESSLKISNCKINTFDILPGILGRTSDLFINKYGELIDMTAITTLLFKMKGIEQIKFIQHSETLIEAIIVAKDSFNESYLYEILVPYFPDLQLQIRIVNKIPISKSGKYIFAKRLFK